MRRPRRSQSPNKTHAEDLFGGSSAGMVALMQLLQSFERHVRINGRRRNVRVTEQQLDDAQIGAVIQKVRRECMSQRMRRQDRAGDARLDAVALDQLPESLAR